MDDGCTSIVIAYFYKKKNMLKTGDKAPAFKGVDQDGNLHQLQDYKGKKLIVFFYPGADTPSCTNEACNLRDHYGELQKQGYELLGVSADTPKKQGKFKTKYNLPFPLIADEDHALIKGFGVWGPKKFMGREYDGIHRSTFVIDEKGKIIRVIDKVKTKEHAAQILDEAAA